MKQETLSKEAQMLSHPPPGPGALLCGCRGITTSLTVSLQRSG